MQFREDEVRHWVSPRVSPPDDRRYRYQCPVCGAYQNQTADDPLPVPELEAWQLLTKHIVRFHVERRTGAMMEYAPLGLRPPPPDAE